MHNAIALNGHVYTSPPLTASQHPAACTRARCAAAMAGPNYGNWLGVLKWSLAQGSDGTSDSNFQPMAEEVRAEHSTHAAAAFAARGAPPRTR